MEDLPGLFGQHHRAEQGCVGDAAAAGSGIQPTTPCKSETDTCKVLPLFCHQVTNLGHIVSENGMATDLSKVQKVQEWLNLTSLKEVFICFILSEVCK